MNSGIPGDQHTTAMAVMPHTHVDRALEAALSLDVPLWPQLPHYSDYEDMYVQAAEHFPGMVLDPEKRVWDRKSHGRPVAGELSVNAGDTEGV